jgi:hypothetical protein
MVKPLWPPPRMSFLFCAGRAAAPRSRPRRPATLCLWLPRPRANRAAWSRLRRRTGFCICGLQQVGQGQGLLPAHRRGRQVPASGAVGTQALARPRPRLPLPLDPPLTPLMAPPAVYIFKAGGPLIITQQPARRQEAVLCGQPRPDGKAATTASSSVANGIFIIPPCRNKSTEPGGKPSPANSTFREPHPESLVVRQLANRMQVSKLDTCILPPPASRNCSRTATPASNRRR